MDVRSRLCLLFLFSVFIVVRCTTTGQMFTELQTETALITDHVEDEMVTDLITMIPPMEEDLMTTSLETSLPERSLSTLEPSVMTTQPGEQTSMASGTSGTTNSTGAMNAPDNTVAPGTSKPSPPKGVTDKTPEVTEGTGSSKAGTAAPASSHQSEKTSTAAPDETEPSSDHSYTGAIIGLFIFLVATAFLFVAIYLVRRRKLRNNYGRLDEDTEGDGGWSAFSKNPIYRGDKDYQPL